MFNVSKWIVELFYPSVGGKVKGVTNVAGEISKEALSALEKKFATDLVTGTVGFSADAAKSTLSNLGRVDHSSRHLIEAGIITANSGSTAARQEFQAIGLSILTSPTKTFDHVMSQGGQAVKGFYGKVNGSDVVIFVAK